MQYRLTRSREFFQSPAPFFALFAAGMKTTLWDGERPPEEAAVTNTGRPSPVFMLIYEPKAHSTLRVRPFITARTPCYLTRRARSRKGCSVPFFFLFASFAASRESFGTWGQESLTRRARSREGCSVPFLFLFASIAASREIVHRRQHLIFALFASFA
jgi:hypothetical protein